MEKPTKEKFGWGETSGFISDAAEKAYQEALKFWQFLKDNGFEEEKGLATLAQLGMLYIKIAERKTHNLKQ